MMLKVFGRGFGGELFFRKVSPNRDRIKKVLLFDSGPIPVFQAGKRWSGMVRLLG
jgi:hypothetical protein